MRKLDNCPGVILILKIHKLPTPSQVSFLANSESGIDGPLIGGIVVFRPDREVLHALTTRLDEVSPHARRVASLLDQLQLHVAAIPSATERVTLS
jgi:hypothetical protein